MEKLSKNINGDITKINEKIDLFTNEYRFDMTEYNETKYKESIQKRLDVINELFQKE